MINLENFRIVQLDIYNLTFEQFKEVESKKDSTKSMKWVRVGGYYSNLSQCLKALKNYIIANALLSSIENYEQLMSLLDELNNKYINCNLQVKEE